MRVVVYLQAAGLCTIAAALAACASPNASGLPAGAASAARALAKQDLLYVSEYGGGVVDVFSYPQGVFVGNLSGLNATPLGECVDKAGDVWVVENNATLQEFAHGGTYPIASLSLRGEDFYACAVDRRTGNLAVTSQSGLYGQQGSVSIWADAQGTPTTYTDPALLIMLWCGYDNQGNLFVDGLPPTTGTFQLAELPQGSQTLVNLTLKHVTFPGNLQWDGKAMAVVDPSHPKADAIDRLKISGSHAKIVGTTLLKGSYEIFGSWIQGHTVIGPDSGPSIDTVQLWKYPAGGRPKRILSKGSSQDFNGVFGSVVSAAR